MGMFMLGAEHDDIGGFVHPDVVAWRPIEEIVLAHRLFVSPRIGGGDPPIEDKPPVRALAGIAIQPLKQRRRIDARRQGEVLAADRAIAGYASEPAPLPEHGTRQFQPY